MTLIPTGGNLEEVQEQTIAPEGEYDLVITNVQTEDDQGNPLRGRESGRPMIRCTVAFEDHDEYRPIMHYVALPDPDQDDEQKLRTMQRLLKRFLHLFDVPYSSDGLDDEDIVGASARARVTQQTYKDSSGEERENNQIQLPPFKED